MYISGLPHSLSFASGFDSTTIFPVPPFRVLQTPSSSFVLWHFSAPLGVCSSGPFLVNFFAASSRCQPFFSRAESPTTTQTENPLANHQIPQETPELKSSRLTGRNNARWVKFDAGERST